MLLYVVAHTYDAITKEADCEFKTNFSNIERLCLKNREEVRDGSVGALASSCQLKGGVWKEGITVQYMFPSDLAVKHFLN